MGGISVITKQHLRIARAAANPIITPRDVKPTFEDWEVLGAFNAGVAEYEGQVVLLLRVAERPVQTDPGSVLVPVLDWRSGEPGGGRMTIVKLRKDDPELDFSDPRVVRNREGQTIYLTSISHLRLAWSSDGERFTVEDRPAVMPEGRAESWGIEDPRITKLDGRYHITYSAVSGEGVAVGLLTTDDFRQFRREGLILAPTNKDVAIFPETIGGRYYMLHRPVPDGIGRPEMWLASSHDLRHWGDHRFLLGLRSDTWENARIGAGCVPIRTDRGWLVLYHGANREHRYCMGAALLDLERPERVLARLEQPFLSPEEEYETDGFFAGVVFACGAVERDGRIMMYYGVSDDSMASVSFQLADLLRLLADHSSTKGTSDDERVEND
jgi:Predicted glycosylase